MNEQMAVSGNVTSEATGLRGLLSRLVKRRVENFSDSNDPSGLRFPEPVDITDEANVATSRLVDSGLTGAPMSSFRHAVLLDIDYPAYLVRSSTPGHYHLYLDVPGGVLHQNYMELLRVLAECGVIEPGYAEASRRRGYSALRFPWVKKGGSDG